MKRYVLMFIGGFALTLLGSGTMVAAGLIGLPSIVYGAGFVALLAGLALIVWAVWPLA